MDSELWGERRGTSQLDLVHAQLGCRGRGFQRNAVKPQLAHGRTPSTSIQRFFQSEIAASVAPERVHVIGAAVVDEIVFPVHSWRSVLPSYRRTVASAEPSLTEMRGVWMAADFVVPGMYRHRRDVGVLVSSGDST